METPFIYGKIAGDRDFTDRKKELELLLGFFRGLSNTIIISPRRWGKSSLVNKAIEQISKDSEYIVCKIDVFNCRSREQFCKEFASAVVKASESKIEKLTASIKKYLGSLAPKISLTEFGQNIDISFGVNFRESESSLEDVIDLPQIIAKDKGKKVIVCIDEFQNIGEYESSLDFQKILRAHWQYHDKVCYCLYGSKRHLLMDIFSNPSMPFYKFGSVMFLNTISTEDWIPFIVGRFSDTGKEITDSQAERIANLMYGHPHYVQQLSQQVWLRTDTKCTDAIIEESISDLMNQLSLLFTNIIDSLTPRQINYLYAIAFGEKNLSSDRVLSKYGLGSSANIKNLRNAALSKELIDTTPQRGTYIQDPMLEYWLKQQKK